MYKKIRQQYILLLYISTNLQMISSDIITDFKNKVSVSLDCNELQKVIKDFESSYVSYKFKITTNPGNFDEAKEQCYDLDGDLLHRNFGPHGAVYHGEISKLINDKGSDKNLWVGIGDRVKENNFRLMNGTEYDPGNENITPTLCYWSQGQPDNALYEGYDEDCAFIPSTGEKIQLHDYKCHKNSFDGRDFYGLCEIPVYKCLPVL